MHGIIPAHRAMFNHEFAPGVLLICVVCVCVVHFVLCGISRVMLSAIDSRPRCVPRLIIRHSAVQGCFLSLMNAATD